MIEIAQILKPQGIKGEVKALPLTNVLEVFDVLKEGLVGNKNMIISHISLRQGFLYIKFKGIETRNDAETLRNQYLKVEKELLEQTKNEDEFLVDDLIGMILYDTNGNLVGQIVNIINYGSCDIFVIDKEGRELQVPYVGDVFIRQGDKLVVDSEKMKEVVV